MRIPTHFKIKGKTWKVTYEVDPKHDDGTICDGLCDFDTRNIILDSKLKRRKKHAVFFHELFHVLVHEAHINPGVRFSGGVEEVLCDAFSDLLITSFTIKWKKKK